MRSSRVVATARQLLAVAQTEQLGFLAAAIAYYAFVSLVPLLLVAVAVATAVAGEAFAGEVLAVASGLFTPETLALLEGALTNQTGRGGATAVGLVVLTWSSLRVFRGLDVAFSRIYGVGGEESFLGRIRDALAALAALVVALGAVVVVGAVLPLGGLRVGAAAQTLTLVVVLTVVFLPMYYVFPDCSVGVREVLPGAVAAALGWTALSVGFGEYAARAGGFQLYGILGGVLLALTWFYFGGVILLGGATLNTVLAGRRDRQLQQEGVPHLWQPMADTEGAGTEGDAPPGETDDGDGVESVSQPVDQADIAQLRRELERFEEEIEGRTVSRDELEADLRKYVRKRSRRGKARGWGPYLVLLYGTVMTLGAFFFLQGVWAVLAMLVVWLSTLGLYALMVLVGVTFTVVGLPGRLRDRISDLRD
jgi:YihY family inner membrane protein